jgi:hypothetical protein
MSEIKSQVDANTSYLDLSYKGYNFVEATTLYEILQFELKESIENSVLEYPLGNINSIYPQGALIPLFAFPYKKMRVKIKWKIDSNKLQLVFLDSQKRIIINSGSYTTSLEYEERVVLMDIPAGASYITIYNENFMQASIEYLVIYSVEQAVPNELSKILLTGVDAIKNVFKMWLFSRKGDYGRKISKGGPLDWILGKPISTITTNEIKERLKRDITATYYNLDASDIVVEEIPENKQYKITLYLTDDYNKYITNLTFIISE